MAETRAPDLPEEAVRFSGLREIAGYRLVREIGRGGMGAVFEAEDPRMKRRVALKVLQHKPSMTEKTHERFQREAWIGGKLNHPNLVKVFDRGVWEDFEYFTMELIDGGSLHDVIKSMKLSGRDPAWNLEFGTREYMSWALAKVAEAARGLEYAHRQGVVHRDVKPMNILLARDPAVVKIADFGLALDMEATRMTTEGSVLGTVAYMAPEQIKGETGTLDARCDIYALGVTLFETLTLELPFTGSTQQLYFNSVLTGQARRPSRFNARVSRDLDIVLGKTLERDPKDRYDTAAAFREDLENVLAFRPIHARPPSPVTKVAKWVRRKPMHAALTMALALGLPTVGVLTVRSQIQQRALDKVEIEKLWTRSLSLRQLQHFDEAAGVLTELLDRDPGYVKALLTRALSLSQLTEAEKDPAARADLEQRSLADADRAIGLLPRAAWPWALKSYLLSRFGRQDEARQAAAAAAERRRDPPASEDLEFDAVLAFSSGAYEKAARIYTDLITREPGVIEERFYRAGVFERLGKLDDAAVDYQVVAGLDPASWLPQYGLGKIRTRQGELDEAESHLRKALALDPGNPEVLTALADNDLARGRKETASGDKAAALEDFKTAENEAREALRKNPDLPWSRLNLGVSLMEQYRISEHPDPALVTEAVTEYDRVVAEERSNKQPDMEEIYRAALLNLCDALIQTREYHRALEMCRAAVDADPKQPNNYYNLAGVYALLGRKNEALDSLERDFELGDTDWEYLANDAWFEDLSGSARFNALLDRMKRASATP